MDLVSASRLKPGTPDLDHAATIPAAVGGKVTWRGVLPVSIFSIAVAASLLILKAAPAPFFWIWITWAGALFGATLCVRGFWLRPILFNIGFVACLLASVEAYLITHEYTDTTFSEGFIVRDPVLGLAPAKGMHAHAFKAGPTGLFHGPSGVLFDVDYTIDSNGLRVAPPLDKDNVSGTVLFFGCSFTFGEGLKDDETLPYQVGARSGGRYRVFNFGFEAYGPAQMLAAIESGMVQRVVEGTPRYAFYVAIPNHIWRVAGRTAWGRHAPRYVLDPDGAVHQEGYFEDRRPLIERLGFRRGGRQLNKSATWRVLSMSDSRITDDDIRLYFAVVRRSQELLTAEYPGIQFRVILWPNQIAMQQRAAYVKLRDGFRKMGIPLDLVEDILPGYSTDRTPYILGPSDHHPNALADRLLAQYILKQISEGHVEGAIGNFNLGGDRSARLPGWEATTREPRPASSVWLHLSRPDPELPGNKPEKGMLFQEAGQDTNGFGPGI